MIQALGGAESSITLNFQTLWANVNKASHWNTAHDHNTTWSGVIFLDGCIEAEAGSDPELRNGDLIVHNPVTGIHLRGFPDACSHHLAVGEMLLFPGYVLHMVVPHNRGRPQISIAFDVNRA